MYGQGVAMKGIPTQKLRFPRNVQILLAGLAVILAVLTYAEITQIQA